MFNCEIDWFRILERVLEALARPEIAKVDSDFAWC